MKRSFLIGSLCFIFLSFSAQGVGPGGLIGSRVFAVKRTNIGAVTVNIPFGFLSRTLAIETPSSNTDEICIDWLGGTAVCPAANTSGDDRLQAGTAVILDNYGTSSISIIAASGTQTIFIRAWR